jgi:hypothetical protein
MSVESEISEKANEGETMTHKGKFCGKYHGGVVREIEETVE